MQDVGLVSVTKLFLDKPKRLSSLGGDMALHCRRTRRPWQACAGWSVGPELLKLSAFALWVPLQGSASSLVQIINSLQS